MTFREPLQLHNAFLLRSKKEFTRLVQKAQQPGNSNQPSSSSGGAGRDGPSSGPRSWSNQLSSLSSYPRDDKVDVNARDPQGRTTLHLIASSLDPASLDYLRILVESLPKSNLQLNAQDVESGWTALHRAMYVGNLAGARMLLAEERVDPNIKDGEGLTCYDLYNSTVEGTNPPESATAGDALFTWGANRNFVLGQGNGDDRSLPDRVPLKRAEKKQWKPEGETGEKEGMEDLRLQESPGVRQVVMAKLHTGVVTTEKNQNVALCGFGSGGRLGRMIHTQPDLAPMPDFPHSIVSLALGQDHSLALTSNGDVLSWGLNRFSVLGYVLDPPAEGAPTNKFKHAPEEPIQTTPRRIVGPLKKEVVLGVAASRCSSACWTEDAVWTWGENHGHLGYDVGSNPIQVLPRKVAGVSQPIIGLALTDYAMACLLDSMEVLIFHRGTNFKLSFPLHPFFADSAMYRPPGFHKKLQVVKVTSSGISFACLSSMGDVYTFALPNPVEMNREANTAGNTGKGSNVKPTRVWSLRKRFTAVQDVALGSDGAIILCTASGHVYVRTRNTKTNNPSFSSSSSKAFKFQRIPYLQRIIKVAANETGAFAAIRSDATPRPIEAEGNKLGADFVGLQPHVRRWMEGRKGSYLLEEGEERILIQQTEDDDGAGGDIEPAAIRLDIKISAQLFQITQQWKPASSYPPLLGVTGSDMVFHCSGRDTPAHQVIVGARSSALRKLLAGEKSSSSGTGGVSLERTKEGLVRIHLPKCEHLTLLLLLHYLYADDVPAVWDSRIGSHVQDLSSSKLNLFSIRTELATLAEALDLQALLPVLSLLTKRLPLPTLSSDLALAFSSTQKLVDSPSSLSPLRPDVILELKDARIGAHQSVLRSRSPFFSALFEDPDWTSSRVEPDANILTVDMRHFKLSVLNPIFRHLYEDAGAQDLFDYFHQETIDQFLDFVFEVLSAANELLIDKLVLICSSVVLRHVNIHNVTGLLSDASFYNARALKESLQLYIAQNIETMLESRLLDSMPLDTLSELSAFIGFRQGLRLPISRSGFLVSGAMERQRDWLALQDIPVPTLRSGKTYNNRPPPIPRSPQLPPTGSTSTSSPQGVKRMMSTSIVGAPSLAPIKAQSSRRDPSGDDDEMFAMDEEDGDVTSLAVGIQASLSMGSVGNGETSAGPSSTKPVWKSRAVEAEKTDLRSIFAAETALSSRPPQSSPSTRPTLPSSEPSTWKLSQKDRKKLQASAAVSSSSRPSEPPQPSASSSSSTPWRLPTPSTTPLRPSPVPFASTSTSTASIPRTPPTTMSRASSSTVLQSPNPLPRRAPSSSILSPPIRPSPANASGEVIVPTRQISSSNLTPRKSSDPAWITPSFASPAPSIPFPPPLPSTSSPFASSSSSYPYSSSPSSSSQAKSSFLAIQLQQSDDKASAAPKPTKTLMEIQEEERKEAQAAKEEREFMIWWENEERRMAAAAGGGVPTSGAGENGRGGKRGGKGGGRGGKKAAGVGASAGPGTKGGEGANPSSKRGRGSTRGGRGGGSSGAQTPNGGRAVDRASASHA